MSLSIKRERGLLSHDEFEFLAQTHHPGLHDLAADALTAARQRLRDLRAKERTLSRDMRRAIRGKAEPRGSSFPGNADKPTRRKQAFAGALKRVNGELARRKATAAREAMRDATRAALLRRKAARRHHPAAGHTGRHGMNPIESDNTRSIVQPAAIGSISQANKDAQAARDNRG